MHVRQPHSAPVNGRLLAAAAAAAAVRTAPCASRCCCSCRRGRCRTQQHVVNNVLQGVPQQRRQLALQPALQRGTEQGEAVTSRAMTCHEGTMHTKPGVAMVATLCCCACLRLRLRLRVHRWRACACTAGAPAHAQCTMHTPVLARCHPTAPALGPAPSAAPCQAVCGPRHTQCQAPAAAAGAVQQAHPRGTHAHNLCECVCMCARGPNANPTP
jgi:hypothetical protein